MLVDEIDKMSPKDQAFLLNLMETSIISETKYGKTRSAQIKTSVFATSNNFKKMPGPLQSRFFMVELQSYTYEQFCRITEKLLSRQRIDAQVASAIADAVWNKSQDVRDCRKIGIMAKTMTDVEFIIDKFFGPKSREG